MVENGLLVTRPMVTQITARRKVDMGMWEEWENVMMDHLKGQKKKKRTMAAMVYLRCLMICLLHWAYCCSHSGSLSVHAFPCDVHDGNVVSSTSLIA